MLFQPLGAPARRCFRAMLVMIALYVLILAGQAADAPGDPDCAGNTAQMVQCANRIFDRADHDMNVVWRDITAALQREDRQWNDHREPRLEIARTAQRTWLAFRDAQCAAEADEEARGGTLYPLIYIGCRTQMTRQRIAQLRSLSGE